MIPEVNIFEILISNFIDKCVDISIAAIKRADSNRKIKNQDFQTRIYQVIIDAINKFTYMNCKDQDFIYSVAEVLLLGFKSGNKDLDDIIGETLSVLGKSDINENRKEFISVLNHEISKEENFDIYKEVLLILLQMKENDSIVVRQIYEKLEQITEILNAKSKDYNRNVGIQDTKFQNNQRNEYVEKWNDVLFLHRNQPIEKQVRLCDVYVLPEYKIEKENKRSGDLDVLINDFISGETKRYSPVIILGDGGMGKTSLVSYICAKYKNEDTLIVVSFKNLNRSVLNNSGIWAALEKELDCDKEDFRSKRLILDGFDEAKIDKEKDKLLVEFLMDASNVRQLRVLITSRKYYVDERKYGFCSILYIQFMSKELINSMCEKYAAVTKEPLCKVENKNKVIGIPFILYMILSLKIKLEENMGLCELYDEIFALNGGIYDRLYDDGMHWISHPDVKAQVHEIAERFAFAMFEKNELELTENEYQKIVESVNTNRIRDFAIANYYDIGTKLSFIHKSIYEYFVAEYLFIIMKSSINFTRKNFASALGNILKGNCLSNEINSFFKFKINNNDLHDTFDIVNETFQLMLRDGMTYYTNVCYKNVIDCEIRVFANMLEIIHFWANSSKFIFDQVIIKYIKCNNNLLNLSITNLSGADLYRANLSGANLSNADLSDADLYRADLNRANLCRANLSNVNLSKGFLSEAKLCRVNLKKADLYKADLYKADLYRANLSEANLSEADLSGANLSGTNLRGADLKGADLRGSKLRGAKLRGADLSGAHLEKANLEGADLRDTILKKTDFQGANLGRTIFTNVIFEGTIFNEAYLGSADMQGAIFKERVEFQKSNLEKAKFHYAKFDDVNMDKADLSGAFFTNANMFDVQFCEGTLKKTDFSYAILDKINFGYADLEEAKFIGANLKGSLLKGAILNQTDFSDVQIQDNDTMK